jgi:hypothetical protein
MGCRRRGVLFRRTACQDRDRMLESATVNPDTSVGVESP